MFNLKTAKVVGTPDGTSWSQVHLFSPPVEEKQEKRGQLLAVVSLTAGEESLTAESGREILSRLNEEYYGSLEPASPFLALRKTLEKINQETQSEIAAAVFYQTAAYLGVVGQSRVVIKRGSSLQTVLAGTEAEIKIASGFIKEEDLFLLGTAEFFNLVAQGTLRAALEAGEPEEAVEILAPIVAGRAGVGGVAAVIAKVVAESEERLGQIRTEEREEIRVFPRRNLVFSAAKKLVSGRLRPSIFVRRKESWRSRRMLFSVAAILIFLLLASVFLGIRKRQAEQETARLSRVYEQARAKFEEGKARLSFQPNKARELLEEAKKLVEENQKLKTKNQKLVTLREEIEKELAKTIREYKFDQLTLFLDLNLVKEGATGERLSLIGDQLVVLDKAGQRLIGINLETKAAAILAGGEGFAQATAVAGEEKKVYTLTPEGILASEAGKTSLLIKKAETWGEIVDLKTYGGNFYLLDKGGQTIWRYPGARNWLGKAQPELNKALSLAIDGSIYMLVDTLPWILKFTAGRQETFSAVGLDKPLASPTRIYTDENAKNIYILDKGNFRVVVLDKTGNYQASYLWAGMEEVTDLVAGEENKRIFLLAKNKIYQIEIK
jgi:hypothetical protein